MIRPGNRFWATVAAQTGGVFLLFFIAIIFDIGAIFEQGGPCGEIEAGVQVIFLTAFFVFIGLIVGFYRGFKPAHQCGSFTDSCVAKTLNTFLIVDIPLLTILVSLQGGLTRSMFSPLFLLIPLAHYTVEQRKQRVRRVLWGILAIVVGILISFFVSVFVSQDRKTLWLFPFTDFQSLARRRYDFAILFVTLISIAIFILQMRIIRIPRNHPAMNDEQNVDEQSDIKT